MHIRTVAIFILLYSTKLYGMQNYHDIKTGKLTIHNYTRHNTTLNYQTRDYGFGGSQALRQNCVSLGPSQGLQATICGIGDRLTVLIVIKDHLWHIEQRISFSGTCSLAILEGTDSITVGSKIEENTRSNR